MNTYLGNFVIFVTSNRQVNADPALKRRLMENVIVVNGLETSEDHITVFKNKLRKGLNAGYVKVNDWASIGSASKNYSFQGGDVTNICLKLNNTILNSINFNKIKYNANNLLSVLGNINDNLVLDAINSYAQDKKEFNKNYLLGDSNEE